jgi:hypothetical protein
VAFSVRSGPSRDTQIREMEHLTTMFLNHSA